MTDSRQGLVGTLALLAATVALLFALALGGDDGRSTLVRDPAASEPAALDPERLLALGLKRTPRVADRVAAIRGLEFKRVPEPRVSDGARLRRLTERRLAQPRVQRRLALAEAELRLLGLLEPARSLDDVASDTVGLTLAYYHPRRDALFLVGDATPAGPAFAEVVLAHELTHALEDQRFGLSAAAGVSDDRVLAESALAEGTATALMIRYARRHVDTIALAAQALDLEASTGGELPRFAEAELNFTYGEGSDFVAELLRLGKGWALVDFAYEERLPATTEQVMHPAKYLDDERPLRVTAPRSPGPGWRALDTGSLGEFGTREVLREAGAGVDAGDAAAGWGADRYRLFARRGEPAPCAGRCRTTHALGVAWRGDDEAEARELARALGKYVAGALDGRRRGRRAWRLDGGWASVSLAGDRVGLGLAPDARAARRLAA